MANTKGKIIIGTALVVVVGVTSWVVFTGLRKRRILKNIYQSIRDIETSEGQMALFEEEEKIKGSYAFDANFWKGQRKQKPDPKYLSEMSSTIARKIATNLYNKIGGFDMSTTNKPFNDDEKGILSEIKKLRSQGQVSMVAYAYANAPLNYGNLSDDVVDALTGWFDKESYIKDLNTYINNLPL